jgi:D-sedoheptulose 7-phosphate isomerase
MIEETIQVTIENLNALKRDKNCLQLIMKAVEMISDSMKCGNKLMICGNGGSAADAQHMAGEFVGRFRKDREPLAAIALTTDTSVLTSIANDYSYDNVFDRQVRVFGKEGDVLFGISTSGSSRNIFEAFKIAKKLSVKTILLTGNTERDISRYSDIVIKTPASDTPRIQEMHLLVEHIICEIVEEYFCRSL